MKDHEVKRVLDGDAWIEYSGHLYEFIGDQDGKHLFSDINDGYPLPVSDRVLRHSSEFYFTEKY